MIFTGYFRNRTDDSLFEVFLETNGNDGVNMTPSPVISDNVVSFKLKKGIYRINRPNNDLVKYLSGGILLKQEITQYLFDVDEDDTSISFECPVVELQDTFSILYYKKKDIILCNDEPIMVRYAGDSGDLYKAAKYSSCTIKLINNKVNKDFFAKRADSVKVTLFKVNEDSIDPSQILWQGYLTPNVYNQNYAYNLEEMELDAIDSISYLQYVPYKEKPSNVEGYEPHVSSLKNIVKNCIGDNFDHILFPRRFKTGALPISGEDGEMYTQLDYIRSDGHSYIVTPYKPKLNTKIVTSFRFNFQVMEPYRYISLFGCDDIRTRYRVSLYSTREQSPANNLLNRIYYFGFDSRRANEDYYNQCVEINEDHITSFSNVNIEPTGSFRREAENNEILRWGYKIKLASVTKNSSLVDGDQYYNGDFYENGIFARNMTTYLHIFGNSDRYGNNINNYSNIDCKYVTIYETDTETGEDTLIHNFIPVLRNSDDVLGFLDTVNNVFYENAGDGEFVIGSADTSEGETTKSLSMDEFDKDLELKDIYISEGIYCDREERTWDKKQEVLESISAYLGLTAIAQGRTLYFLDYNWLGKDCYYLHYNGNFESTGEYYILDDYINYQGSADDATSVSYAPVYSKVTIKNSTDDISSLTNNLFEDATNLFDEFKNFEGSKIINGTFVTIYSTEYLKNNLLADQRFMRYNNGVKEEYTVEEMFKMLDILGQDPLEFLAGSDTVDTNSSGILLTQNTITYNVGEKEGDHLVTLDKGSDTEYICIISPNDTTKDFDGDPVISIKTLEDDAIVPDLTYLVIDFNVLFSNQYYYCSNPEIGNNYDIGVNDAYNSLVINTYIKYGDKYWGGTNTGWTTNRTVYPIRLDYTLEKDNNNNSVVSKVLNNTFSVLNQVEYDFAVKNQKGAVIPITNNISDANFNGDLEIQFLPQIAPNVSSGSSNPCKTVWINNLSVTLAKSKKEEEYVGNKEDKESYEETIDDTYIEEMRISRNKLTTYRINQFSYNTAYLNYSGNYYIMKGLYDNLTNSVEIPEVFNINKRIIQYRNPRLRVNQALFGTYRPFAKFANKNVFGNIEFVVDEQEIDYKLDITRLNLLELR